jgi:hypothetical protein
VKGIEITENRDFKKYSSILKLNKKYEAKLTEEV